MGLLTLALFKHFKNDPKYCLFPSKPIEIKSAQIGSWIPFGDPREEILTPSGRTIFASRGSHGIVWLGEVF